VALSNGLQRTLFAMVAAPVFIAALWAGGALRQGFLCLLVGAAVWEYVRILRGQFPSIGKLPELLVPLIAVAMVSLSPWGTFGGFTNFRDLALVLSIQGLLILAFRRLPREQVFPWVGLTAVGLAYLGGWGSSFFALSAGPRGWTALAPAMMAFGACWVGDTSAYVVGRAIGKNKLCPELSPAKTVEGAVAGIFAPAVFGWFWGTSFLGLPSVDATVLGAALGLAGIVGDLAESVFKRWAGVKDSSNLLPGHGGVLDRFDSAFLAAPLLQFALAAFFRR